MKKPSPDYPNLLVSLVSKLARLTGQALEKRLAPIGVTLQEFRIVGLLLGDPGKNQKDLAEMLSVTPATLSVAVNRLVDKGVLNRSVSGTDKRVNLLSIAPDVDFAATNDLLGQLETRMLKGIKKADIATTRKVIVQMIENLSGRD